MARLTVPETGSKSTSSGKERMDGMKWGFVRGCRVEVGHEGMNCLLIVYGMVLWDVRTG